MNDTAIATTAAYLNADDVKTFGSLTLPVPAHKRANTSTLSSQQKLGYSTKVFTGNEKHEIIPSGHDMSLRTTKPPTIGAKDLKYAQKQELMNGFSAANLILDGKAPSPGSRINTGEKQQKQQTAVNTIDIGDFDPKEKNNPPGTAGTNSSVPKVQTSSDQSLVELRNYASLMDQYSLHNFMIYNGCALKSTPEFVSYHRIYKNEWGGIYSIIMQLEQVMASHNVKLAIINGLKVYELSSLNLPYIERADLLGCVSNIEQILPQLQAISTTGTSYLIRAVVKIQTHVRKWIAKLVYVNKSTTKYCVLKIQSHIRRYLASKHVTQSLKCYRLVVDEYFESNAKKVLSIRHMLEKTLLKTEKQQSGMQTPPIIIPDEQGNYTNEFSQNILLVHIPGVDAFEQIRINIANVSALQNADVVCFHQLANPHVSMLYIVPSPVTTLELNYYETLFQMLELPADSINRIHFITPELITHLPSHTTMSNILWYSWESLNKIRLFSKRYAQVVLVPTSVSWVAKRLSYYLKIPILSADPTVTETISSRSQMKNIFMESSINIPVGAHDIFNEQDALIAFSRLIASNVDVNRWIMKLNYDYNNESTCILDLSSVPFMLELREEQKTLQKMNETDANFWYGRSLQISIRKRILKSLQQAGLFVANNNRGSSVGSRSLSSGSNSHVPTTTPGLLYICRKDIFTSWNAYANYMGVYGAVIEAEPPGDILGYLRACCYIHPLEAVGTSSSSAIVTPRNEHGRDFISVNIQDMPLEGMNQHDTADAPLSNLMQPDVEYVGGLDMIVDVNNQYQGYCYPQKQIPEEGLKGAAMSLCNYLYIKYNVIGYVEVNFLLFWDSYAHVPKMWGLDFAFGHRLSHSCCSIINHLAHRVQFDRVHHAQDDFNGKTNYDELLPILKYRKSMLYPPCEGRCCVYFPMAIQHSLKGTRDDVFYKLCGMNGIAYDHTRRIGTLFFLIDTIVGGGVVSVMCISTTRAKCLELAIDVFTFISKQFGKNSKSKQIMPEDVCWQHGHSILLNLKKCIKKIDKTKK